MKKKKTRVSESYRIKTASIDLINRLDSGEIPFNAKLHRILVELAKIKGIEAE